MFKKNFLAYTGLLLWSGFGFGNEMLVPAEEIKCAVEYQNIDTGEENIVFFREGVSDQPIFSQSGKHKIVTITIPRSHTNGAGSMFLLGTWDEKLDNCVYSCGGSFGVALHQDYVPVWGHDHISPPNGSSPWANTDYRSYTGDDSVPTFSAKTFFVKWGTAKRVKSYKRVVCVDRGFDLAAEGGGEGYGL